MQLFCNKYNYWPNTAARITYASTRRIKSLDSCVWCRAKQQYTLFEQGTRRRHSNGCLSVSRRVLINSIFENVYSYCAYTPMSCIHNFFNLNLWIKGKNIWNFAWISIWVSTTSSLFEQCILLLRSTSDAGIQRLYTSSRGYKYL
jgi:hypothetical protein